MCACAYIPAYILHIDIHFSLYRDIHFSLYRDIHFSLYRDIHFSLYRDIHMYCNKHLRLIIPFYYKLFSISNFYYFFLSPFI